MQFDLCNYQYKKRRMGAFEGKIEQPCFWCETNLEVLREGLWCQIQDWNIMACDECFQIKVAPHLTVTGPYG